jgi:Fe-S cluster assembly protein SufD
MTITAAPEATPYLRAFESLEQDGHGQRPDWLRALRRDAIDAFTDLGFPTARRGNEEWKYTDVRPIARAGFSFPTHLPSPDPNIAAHLESLGNPDWHRLVFLNGHYSPTLSSPPNGVTTVNLPDALDTHDPLIQQHLARHASYGSHAFTALNTAFLHQGSFIHLPPDTVLDNPLHLIYLSTAAETNTLSQPRTLAVIGRGSKATIVETYAGPNDIPYLSNAVSELILEANSSLDYYRLQQHGDEGCHVGTTQAVLGDGARFSSTTLDLGGALVRNNLNALLDAPESSCTLNGLYLAGETQKIDNQVVIDHASPHTNSRELYKGILGGRARAAFHGSITVRKDAQKVDAKQEDKNLLLSDKAQVNVKPAFWIYADDVKCGHGAASGQIDENSLFYLQSRGIGHEEAHRLLVRGFANEIIETVESPSIKSLINNLVKTKLTKL